MGNCLKLGKNEATESIEYFTLPVGDINAIKFGLRYLDCIQYGRRKDSLNAKQFEKEWFLKFRVGINIFNSNSKYGIQYLIEKGYLENSSDIISTFLLNCFGLCKREIGSFLCNQENTFASDVLKKMTKQMKFQGLSLDKALRRFQSYFKIPDSSNSENTERVLKVFSEQYSIYNDTQCSQFKNPDTVFIITIFLFTLSKNIKIEGKEKIISKSEFRAQVLEAVNDRQVTNAMLEKMYKQIVKEPLCTICDHLAFFDNFSVYSSETKEMLNLGEHCRRVVYQCTIQRCVFRSQKYAHFVRIIIFNDILTILRPWKRNSYELVEMITLPDLEIEMYQHHTSNRYCQMRLKDRISDNVVIMLASHDENPLKILEIILLETISEAEETAYFMHQYEIK